MSTRTFTIVIGVIVVAFLIGLAAIFLTKGGASSGSATTTPSGGLFGGESGATSGGTGTQGGGIPVTLSDGSTVSVPDFTKQGQPPIAGPQTGYQVAGSDTGDYQILYFPDQSYFNITLNAEPLGATRLAAEASLRQKLGLSDDELCKLNSQVGVPANVNQSYAGRSLGLSFCSGSVQLP